MNKRERVVQFGYLDDELTDWIRDKELENVLNETALHIGWIIIEFNRLEQVIHFMLEQLLSNSQGRDEIVNIFLSEMSFSSKQNLLIKIYGQYISRVDNVRNLEAQLEKVESRLSESLLKRNRYAHADFGSISKGKFVKVKTKAKKDGVYHTFVKFDTDDMGNDLEYIHNTIEILDEFVYFNVYAIRNCFSNFVSMSRMVKLF